MSITQHFNYFKKSVIMLFVCKKIITNNTLNIMMYNYIYYNYVYVYKTGIINTNN